MTKKQIARDLVTLAITDNPFVANRQFIKNRLNKQKKMVVKNNEYVDNIIPTLQLKKEKKEIKRMEKTPASGLETPFDNKLSVDARQENKARKILEVDTLDTVKHNIEDEILSLNYPSNSTLIDRHYKQFFNNVSMSRKDLTHAYMLQKKMTEANNKMNHHNIDYNTLHGSGLMDLINKGIEAFINYISNRKKTNNPAEEAFKFLGLPSNSSKSEIKKRYRQLALQMHPDKGGTHEGFILLKDHFDTAMNNLSGGELSNVQEIDDHINSVQNEIEAKRLSNPSVQTLKDKIYANIRQRPI